MRRVIFAVRGFRYGYVLGELHSWMLRWRLLEGGKTRDLRDSNVRGNVDIDVKVNGRFSTLRPHFAATVRRGTRLCILPPMPSHLLCLRRRIRTLVSLEVPTPRITVAIELDAASKTYWSLSIVSRRRAIFPMDSDWLASIECIPLRIAS